MTDELKPECPYHDCALDKNGECHTCIAVDLSLSTGFGGMPNLTEEEKAEFKNKKEAEAIEQEHKDKRNEFTQHIPSCASGPDDHYLSFNFETTEELICHPFIKKWVEDDSSLCLNGDTLMITRNEGLYWWVIGFIERPERVDLPQWDGGKYLAKMSDGIIRVLQGKEVVSSCGDRLRLKDGTTAINLSY